MIIQRMRDWVRTWFRYLFFRKSIWAARGLPIFRRAMAFDQLNPGDVFKNAVECDAGLDYLLMKTTSVEMWTNAIWVRGEEDGSYDSAGQFCYIEAKRDVIRLGRF